MENFSIRDAYNAIARDGWAGFVSILSYGRRYLEDKVVSTLINNNQWSTVSKFIRTLGDHERTWNIGGVLVKNNILLSVADSDWTCIQEIHDERYLDSTFQWIIRQACTRATNIEVVLDLLHQYADDGLGSVLTILVERRLWRAVGQVLVRGVSASLKQWAVREACKHCKKEDLVTLLQIILPHCAEDQADYVLTTLVERRLWQAVGKILKKGVSDSNKQWAVREACKHCKKEDLVTLLQIILPHCAEDQADYVLTTLVERRLWPAVEEMLKKGVSDSNKQWAVREACKHCEQIYFGSHYFRSRSRSISFLENQSSVEQFLVDDILPHCDDNQLDSVLTTLVERRLWHAGAEVLKKGVSDSNKQWAVPEAFKHCKKEDLVTLLQIILPHCAEDQADHVLTTLVERRLWQAVGEMLKKGVSDSNKQWAVREACKHCKKEDLVTLLQIILPHCAEDQADYVLTTLVERRLWQAVGEMLKKGVSDSINKQWAVREACKHCEGYELECLIENILPHCAVDQLDSVLTTLVERRLWHAGAEVLKKGVSDSNKQWAVPEAFKHCKKEDLVTLLQIILPHCAEDQADYVLTTLVERRLWQAVGEMLKKGVSDSNKQWAVREACKHCKKEDLVTLLQIILPHCAEDQADYVLTTLVERRLWQAVGEMLKKGVSDSINKQWAVREACKHCEGYELECLIENILPHCAVDQLDSVLKTLVERRLWRAVLYVLKRGVREFSKLCVVLEVCTCQASGVQEQVLSDILLFCADDDADFVLTILVERLQWFDVRTLKLVVELLQRGVSETLAMWAVEQARKGAKSDDFIKYVLTHCPLNHLNSVLPNIVKNGELRTVDIVMRRHHEEMEMESFVLPRWYVDVLPSFVQHRLWNYVQEILHSVVMNSLCHLVTREGEIKEDDSVLLAMVNTCRVNATCAVQLFKAVKEKAASKARELHECLGLTEDLCELLYTSCLDQVCVAICSEAKETKIMSDSLFCHVRDIYTEITSCIQTINTNSVEGMVVHFKRESRIMTSSGKLSSISAHHFLMFLKQFNLYYTCKRRDDDDELLLKMFAVLPLSPVLQSVALRIMLRHKRWDVISHANLSSVWEQDRRHLLQAAVKQRQWSVVKRWADHTLYDDQRVLALNEALNEKQCDVALLLADYGLTDIDLMRVHYRLAKYADWDVILHMFERGADVAEVIERLGRMKDNKRISEKSQRYINDRHSQVKTLETTVQKENADALENACRGCNWIFVLYALLRNPAKESVRCALKVAMKKKAWHVVMQLVRVAVGAIKRHSLFTRMMKRRQWGVCRVLLEQRLSVRMCLKVLPQLMEMNQWALVARVMEHDVGDDVRHQVMQRAWERREGSVVWLCIKSLPTPLSVEEREALFQRAFSCELWQVIKPLVEVKDETGIRHRDTALLEAIEQHQWDLVDHCQRHHADINMKDDDDHTPLQRAAMKKDWEAVEELVVRDGDPNLLDREGYTVLHRAIEEKQWDIVNLLIQYQADIHKKYNSDFGGVTPLRMLMDNKRADMIELSLLWCPDQAKGVNRRGETPLHVSCVAGCYDSIYYLMARGVPPLAVTNAGQSGLVYAVLNKDCPQRMVAECIRLGFSTHQPKLTNIEADQTCLMPHYLHGRLTWLEENRITSPFLCAVLRSVPGLMQMLYESGACSQREMFRLYTQVYILADTTTKERRKVQALAGHQKSKYQNFERCIADALPYLTEIATTPRSLESMCCLVISHCLTLGKTRHRDVDQLPLPERMKDFVLFSHITDPYFGKDTT